MEEVVEIAKHQNSRYQSLCFKTIDAKDIGKLEEGDGYMYTFVAPMEGTNLNENALKVLHVLNYLINQPFDEACVLNTNILYPRYSEVVQERGQTAVKCQMIRRQGTDWKSEYEKTLEENEILKGTIDEEPPNFITVYRGEDDAENETFDEEIVALGKIYVAPVHVTREDEATGIISSDNFWLIIMKTVYNFDFEKHIQNIIASCEFSNNKHKDSLRFKGRDTMIDDLENILLFAARMSPTARAYMKQNNTSGYMFDYIGMPNTPLNLKSICNILESYRAMRWPPWISTQNPGAVNVCI